MPRAPWTDVVATVTSLRPPVAPCLCQTLRCVNLGGSQILAGLVHAESYRIPGPGHRDGLRRLSGLEPGPDGRVRRAFSACLVSASRDSSRTPQSMRPPPCKSRQAQTTNLTRKLARFDGGGPTEDRASGGRFI